MIKLIIKWLIFALVIMGTCYLPGISVDSFWFAMLIAAVLTIVNIFIKPLLKLIAFPLNLLSFGLFNLVINFGILYAVAYFIPQYHLENTLSAFIASVIIAISYVIIKKL
ncbi:phage holin family protein [bacterium]|nr:phage holin family protein [bacterium]MBP3847598.1 phage holin family protein [bacterium]